MSNEQTTSILKQKATDFSSRKFLAPNALSGYLLTQGKVLLPVLITCGWAAAEGVMDTLRLRYSHNAFVQQLLAYGHNLIPDEYEDDEPEATSWETGHGTVAGLPGASELNEAASIPVDSGGLVAPTVPRPIGFHGVKA